MLTPLAHRRKITRDDLRELSQIEAEQKRHAANRLRAPRASSLAEDLDIQLIRFVARMAKLLAERNDAEYESLRERYLIVERLRDLCLEMADQGHEIAGEDEAWIRSGVLHG
jgi:hypothetical protein